MRPSSHLIASGCPFFDLPIMSPCLDLLSPIVANRRGVSPLPSPLPPPNAGETTSSEQISLNAHPFPVVGPNLLCMLSARRSPPPRPLPRSLSAMMPNPWWVLWGLLFLGVAWSLLGLRWVDSGFVSLVVMMCSAGLAGGALVLNKADMALDWMMKVVVRLARVGFTPVCFPGVVLVWQVVRGGSVSLFIRLSRFLVRWMVVCWDRSPRCRRFFSARGMIYLHAFPFSLLRTCGVSAPCSCLLTAQAFRWYLGVVGLDDALDGDLRAHFIS